jgi:hypothetical protein
MSWLMTNTLAGITQAQGRLDDDDLHRVLNHNAVAVHSPLV